MSAFNGVRIFSATMVAQRLSLGDTVTTWLENARTRRPGFQVVEMLVRQSSDKAFHCFTICLFYKEDLVVKETPRRG